jgi:AICAR transformylase/IMP cyclohydrolase PurH
MESTGLRAATYFIAPKGSYRIREVVREAVHNGMAASFTPVKAQ